MVRSPIVFCLLLLSAIFSEAYVFKCLDDCDCDTDDETIHCHNRLNRQSMGLPETRLRGFRFIGMTHNDIRTLPSQAVLLAKFPELEAVDLAANRNFNCSLLPQYVEVQILTDCGKEVDEFVTYVPDVQQDTEDCDHKCQVKKHYDKLHAYFLKFWDYLQAKFDEVNKTQMVTDVRKWFADVMANVRTHAPQPESDR